MLYLLHKASEPGWDTHGQWQLSGSLEVSSSWVQTHLHEHSKAARYEQLEFPGWIFYIYSTLRAIYVSDHTLWELGFEGAPTLTGSSSFSDLNFWSSPHGIQLFGAICPRAFIKSWMQNKWSAVPLHKMLGTILYFLESVPCSWALKNAVRSCLGDHTWIWKGVCVVSPHSL